MKFLKKFNSENKYHVNSYVARKRKNGIIYIVEDMQFMRNLIWIYKIKNINTNMHEWVSENSLRDLTETEKMTLDTKKYNV